MSSYATKQSQCSAVLVLVLKGVAHVHELDLNIALALAQAVLGVNHASAFCLVRARLFGAVSPTLGTYKHQETA